MPGVPKSGFVDFGREIQSMKLLVSGAECLADVPGLDAALACSNIAFAPDERALAQHLPDSDILLGWNFRGRDLRNQWAHANQLKWIHWCGAGVDAVLFPQLVDSHTILTNARGIFDRAIAEYVLGYMLTEVKGFRETWKFQSDKSWHFRLTGKLSGGNAVVFGVGSIGREIGRLLTANGVNVAGVGRSRRSGDDDFGEIYTKTEVLDIVAEADWVIGVMPLTTDTHGYFDETFFSTMKPSARFINVGRGQSVIEDDLKAALRQARIAGALLDVFAEEPVPDDSPLWDTANLMVSPHMSGDYAAAQEDMVKQFLANLEKFVADEALMNVVDKELGFVR